MSSPVEGWRRDMPFAETGLPWVRPSPNMPDVESATHYPGTCLFEGTVLSVARGTEAPFQQIGAPWLDGDALAQAMNGYGLPGVRFEPVRFTPNAPSDGKFDGVEVEGVRLVPRRWSTIRRTRRSRSWLRLTACPAPGGDGSKATSIAWREPTVCGRPSTRERASMKSGVDGGMSWRPSSGSGAVFDLSVSYGGDSMKPYALERPELL